jgi:excisionase family DNA binding protein
MEISKKAFSVREVAARFGINPITVIRKINNGLVPAYKVGSHWRIEESDLHTVKTVRTAK